VKKKGSAPRAVGKILESKGIGVCLGVLQKGKKKGGKRKKAYTPNISGPNFYYIKKKKKKREGGKKKKRGQQGKRGGEREKGAIDSPPTFYLSTGWQDVLQEKKKKGKREKEGWHL